MQNPESITPQATAASPNTSLPYPIGTGAFYTTCERSSRRGEETTARRWSAGQASSSTHTPEDIRESEGEYETDNEQDLESEPEPRSELEDPSKEKPSEPSDNESDNDNIMANPPQPVVERGCQ